MNCEADGVTLLRITEWGHGSRKTIVVPAKAGTQWRWYQRHWIPAFAGMTNAGAFGGMTVCVLARE